MNKVNLDEKLALIDDLWSPKIVAKLNDYDIQVAKAQGEFVWHEHADTDEFFLVLKGRLTIQMRDGEVELGPGELFVVPKGVEHRPSADDGVEVLLIEPAGTVNTGNAGGELTAVKEPI
ncbi:MAG: cupin domain-containing protein [Acidimicrobiia bacterium]|nr:cupin domain-containing protein [Acidimicrobiia bacterium]